MPEESRHERPYPKTASTQRVFPRYRAGHVDELDSFVPRKTLFFKRSYDMIEIEPPDHVRRVSLLKAALIIGRERTSDPVELWEPLWFRFLPHWVFLAIIVRVSGRISGTNRGVVFYAIENNDLDQVLFNGRTVPGIARRLARVALRWLLGFSVARVAFGSDGAAATYVPIVPRKVETRLFRELPASRVEPDVDTSGSSGAVLFAGILQARKGVVELMSAWELVEQDETFAGRLTIVGGGDLEADVVRWASERPSTRRAPGWLARREVVAEMRRSQVLVAPSIPLGRWREQIGRAIREGLAEGLTIVTTDQTGIAEFLRETGHHVVRAPVDVGALAQSIRTALEFPLRRDEVGATLPKRDGRLLSDEWMHR